MWVVEDGRYQLGHHTLLTFGLLEGISRHPQFEGCQFGSEERVTVVLLIIN